MENKEVIQLIHSLRNEFAEMNFTDDSLNNTPSLFFNRIQGSGKSLHGEEKILYDVLKDTFVLDYYNANFWNQDLANMHSEDLSQIETWSALDFKYYITESFKKNDFHQEEMKNIHLSEYHEFFQSHQDITYYKTLLEWYLTRKINFLSNKGFFSENDLKNNEAEISDIYDQLIRDNDGNAKLHFMYEKIHESSLSTDLDPLEQLQTLYEADVEGDYKVLVLRDMMSIYHNRGDREKTLAIAEEAKQKFPDSAFLKEIQYKTDLITNPVLRLNFEKQAQSNKPIHLVAEHQNISDFILNIYEVNSGFKALFQDQEDYFSKNNFYDQVEKKLVRKEYYKLPKNKSKEKVKTSLEIKPMSPGLYAAEFSLKEPTTPDSRFHFYFSVSDHQVLFHHKDQNDYPETFTLVDSEKGKPVPHEDLIFFEYTGSDFELIKLQTKTDENGYFKIPPGSSDKYYKKYIIQQPRTHDFQFISFSGTKFSEDDQDLSTHETKAQIFTDRAIYRPGQTVYFKVIHSKIEHEKESVISGIKQKIVLIDANDQEISAQEFITSEFGSYHGSFVLPKGKLNGLFTLSTVGEAECHKYFRVEEYKRPRFEVTFEPVKGEYKYGHSLEIKGKAIMLSGIALSHVTVEYEIKKSDIRWKFFDYPLKFNEFDDSILGKVETDRQGEFTIPVTFNENPSEKGIQIDRFEIEATVTDINGETQSASMHINVASVSYYINAEFIKDAFTDENLTVKVETRNYNNQSVEKPYHVKLSKLSPIERIFRNSFNGEIQNRSLFSEEEFIAKFPYDHFDESEYDENRKIEKVILDALHTPSEESNLDLGKLEAGRYKLELFDSQQETPIKTVQYFNVWNNKTSIENEKTFLSVLDPQKEFLRGEKVTIYAYSSIPDASVNIFLQDGLGNTVSEVREFQKGILKYSIAIPEDKSISVLNIQFQLIAYNDIQHHELALKIKEEESPLNIETTTFRDKIEPGSQEKWSVKVSGKDSEPIIAEVLATMYDKALDHFATHTFKWQELRMSYYITLSYDLRHSIDAKLARKTVPYVPATSIELPYFNWYDGDLPGDVTRLAGSSILAENITTPEKRHNKIDTGGRNDKEMGLASRENNNEGSENSPVRQNLNETAFFYPDLKTDSEGNISFEFTSPEALTKWRVLFLAHTRDAKAAILEKELITQKEFSVTPNYPRFLREADELNFQSKLSNLTDKKLNGFAELQILDALTNEDISHQFSQQSNVQNFEVSENGNSVLTWAIKVPENISSIIIKVIAKAGQYSDGEQKAIAVLPNRTLVTDALPIFVKEGETKTFELKALTKTVSNTITNVSNTLELTTHPIWEIMSALPAFKNEQNNSADVIFNKWFADVLAAEIFRANPKMKTIFEDHQNKGLLNSDLEKNQDLKQLLLDETPWVLESKNEDEQMKKLALLFDVNSMKLSIRQDWNDFRDLQNRNGGFSWYQGYPSSYSTSLYILKNLGKINNWLKDHVTEYQSSDQKDVIEKLIQYVDKEISQYSDVKQDNIWNNWVIAYLDARNYWEKQYPLQEEGAALKSLIIQTAKDQKIKDFTFFGLHRMALLMNDYGLQEVSNTLISYLKRTSTDSKTQGIYWKQNLDDWGWFRSKVVNHAGVLEAFNTLLPDDQKFIEEVKIWLITQKEVNSWGSSRSTAEVIFTILNSGKSWTAMEPEKVTVVWGSKELKPETEAAGYIQSSVKTNVLDKNLATVTITKPGPGIIQGGLFWQYYEDLNAIKSSENTISVSKELYKKVKTVYGDELQKISAENPLKTGDKVTVRMILNTDRAMEFIHIKDMRAAGFEPIDTLSGYRWRNNLGYYQSTKDASTNFYIEHLPKGKYVFEYDYMVNASGKFSNGITTIQNYYAPQMNAHTKGSIVEIN